MLKKSLACACLVSMAHLAAHAGRVDNVKIIAVEARSDGYFIVTLDTPIAGGPACAAQYPTMMGGNLATPGGRAIFDAASAAYQNASRVYVQGLGTCPDLRVIESFFEIVVGAH